MSSFICYSIKPQAVRLFFSLQNVIPFLTGRHRVQGTHNVTCARSTRANGTLDAYCRVGAWHPAWPTTILFGHADAT